MLPFFFCSWLSYSKTSTIFLHFLHMFEYVFYSSYIEFSTKHITIFGLVFILIFFSLPRYAKVQTLIAFFFKLQAVIQNYFIVFIQVWTDLKLMLEQRVWHINREESKFLLTSNQSSKLFKIFTQLILVHSEISSTELT